MTDPYLLFQFQLNVQRNGKILNQNTAEKATKPTSGKGFLCASVNIAFNLIWYKWFKFHTNESMIKLPHDFFFPVKIHFLPSYKGKKQKHYIKNSYHCMKHRLEGKTLKSLMCCWNGDILFCICQYFSELSAILSVLQKGTALFFNQTFRTFLL